MTPTLDSVLEDGEFVAELRKNEPILHIAILIPARNEQLLLPRCLRSVAEACAALPPSVTTDIILVADCCTDRTAALAREILGSGGSNSSSGIVVCAEAGSVGAARALAAGTALARSPVAPARCWLANTDADCEVPPDWLLLQLHFAARGFRAIAGIIDVDHFLEHDAVVEERFRLTYPIYPDGTHPHVHGANLGVRADAYLQAGGWPALATAEDHDLWRRLEAHRHPRLSEASLRVLTSGRREGRAPNGFAEALAAHNDPL